MGYRQKPGSVYRYANGTRATANALGYRGPVVTLPKPAGTFRIVLLGGSTTHGWGVNDDETLDRFLRDTLRRARGDLAIDVVNLGFDGYDALQLLERLRSEAPRFAPDVAIIHEGINDVRNARLRNLVDRDPRTVIWAAVLDRERAARARGGHRLWDRIKHWSYAARLPAVARNVSRQAAQTRQGAAEPPHPEAAEFFERNLRRIADYADSSGFAVLFSTAPSSLRIRYDSSGMVGRTYFVVDNATTQTYRDTLAARLQRVARALAEAGRRVAYVAHGPVPADEFLDDAHLTAAGNRRVAAEFAAAILPLLPAPRRP
jgi:lysophospholipase L1-like esterase